MDIEAIITAPGAAQALPGPQAVPLLGWRGNMLPLLRTPVPFMMALYKKYGDLVALAKGDDKFIFAFSPELNHQILSDQQLFYNGDITSGSGPVKIPQNSAAMRLFSGLTTRNGADHTRQRRLLMPTFHRKHIDSLRDDMVDKIDSHIADWKPGQQRDILGEMKRLTLSVAVQTILGLDPEKEGEKSRLLLERWLRTTLSPGVFVFPLDAPGTPFRKRMGLADEVEQEINAMIARKRASGLGHDALSMLLQAHDEDGVGLTDNELLGHTMTLFVAGHETTASALTWTLFLLDQHPAVLNDLVDELNAVLHGAAPRVDQLNSMPLLDAVLNESMRLLPPGLFFLRVPTEPTRLGNYDVAKGTNILWSPAVTHRIPELYPDPQRFDPSRWQKIDPSPYEYLPFGAGPRRCLGATFAMMELKLTLGMLLPRYRLALAPGAPVNISRSPLAAPRNGLPMLLAASGVKIAPQEVRGNIRQLVDLN